MADSILVDTDILIDVSRNVEEAKTCILRFNDQSVIHISAVTQMELTIGCRNKTELKLLDHFIDKFKTLPINEVISNKAIELIRQYRLSHGLMIPDALIAATSITTSIPLITKNQRDYTYINGLIILPYPIQS